MTDIAAILKALTEEARVKILALTCDEGRTAAQIADGLGLDPAAVRGHLAQLEGAGLIETSPPAAPEDAVFRYSRRSLVAGLKALETQALPDDLPADAAPYDRKVVGDYLTEGRLKTIPMQRKKRDVILRYLAQQFEPGREYPEKEVNALLGARHEDFATLRREMVDGKLLERKNNVYWRARSGRLI